MSDAPEKIWARVKATSHFIGANREVGEIREWCEGYATPEIAQTCKSTEYTRSDIAQARIDKLERALQEFNPVRIGRVQSMDQSRKLHNAWVNAYAALKEDE